MKLKARLMLIVAVPLTAAIALAVTKEVSEVRHLLNEREVAQKIRLSAEISDLVHHLQRERGYSAGYVSSTGQRFDSELTAQRPETDRYLQGAQEALALFKASGISYVPNFERRIASLTPMRARVTDRDVTVSEMAEFYTAAIDHLIKALETVIKRVEEPKVTEAARVFGALIVAKEHAGRERALGAVGFGAGAFTPEQLMHFAAFGGAEESIIAEAATSGDPRIGGIVEELIASPEHKALQRLRELAPPSLRTGELGGVDGPTWFKTSTAWIDRVQAAEFELRGLLVETSSKLISDATNAVILQSVITLLIIFAATAWANIVSGKVEREAGKLSEELRKVADGDLAEPKSSDLTTPEFSAIREMAKVFRVNARERNASEEARTANERALDEVVDKLSMGLSSLSEGDLKVEIPQPFPAPYERLRHDFNGALQRLQALIGEVSDGMKALDQNARSVKTASSQLASRTEDQAQTLVESSKSARKLKSLVGETAESAGRTEQFAADTRARAESGAEVVGKAVAAMSRIEDSSEQISKIVKVIEDIAKQTNLLSLNAGVEAARAGESGRGFALVANEVRSLAKRADDAAQEIKVFNAKSSEEIASGVELVSGTGDVFGEIVTGVQEIGGLVSEISKASRRQADAVSTLTQSIETIDRATHSNAGMAEEMTAAAVALFDQANKVNAAAEVFNAGEDGAPQPALPQAASEAA